MMQVRCGGVEPNLRAERGLLVCVCVEREKANTTTHKLSTHRHREGSAVRDHVFTEIWRAVTLVLRSSGNSI